MEFEKVCWHEKVYLKGDERVSKFIIKSVDEYSRVSKSFKSSKYQKVSKMFTESFAKF